MTCDVTQTSFTAPTCGSCNGAVSFSIPVACSSNPVYAVWNSGGGSCSAIPTATLTPGSTYVVNNICGCGTTYQINFTNDPVTQDSTYNVSGPNMFSGNNISITSPSAPKIALPFTTTQPSCFGGCDGQINMTIQTGDGTRPISSTWIPPIGSSTTHTNLSNISPNNKDILTNSCAGIYSVFLTDKNGCTSGTSTVSLGQPSKVVSIPTFTAPICFGFCTGAISDVNTSGGTSPYTYFIDSIGVVSSMPGGTISGLCAGTYTVFAKDAHSCPDTNIIVIGSASSITFVQTPASGITNIPCSTVCNGSVSIASVSGGTSPYTFSWLPSGGTVTSTTNSSTYSGLCGSSTGTIYTCTITDKNHCSKIVTFTVTSPATTTLTPTFTNPKCNLSTDGSATVTASGGTSPFSFVWSGAGTPSGSSPTSIYSGLGGGTYTVTATDNNSCTTNTTVVLTAPNVLTSTITTKVDPTCPSLHNGQLCVTAGGGTPGYSYSWTPSSAGTASCTPSTLTVTPGGTSIYTVTVTDANLCSVILTSTLTSPPNVAVTTSITPPNCSASCNGSAKLTTISGTAPYQYVWSCPTSTTNILSGQCGGTSCSYTVTDKNNCITKGTVTIPLQSSIAVVKSPVSGITNVLCNSICNGSVSVASVSGGTAPYTFSWTPTGGTVTSTTNSSTYSGLCGSSTGIIYTCTITDKNNCSQTATFTLTSPPAITLTPTFTDPLCSSGTTGSATVTATGGTSPFSFVWTGLGTQTGSSPTSVYSNLGGGTYTVTATDNNSCTTNTVVTLTPAATVTASISTLTQPTCPGLNNGQLCVTAGGGTPGYSYSWTPSSAGTASCTPSTLTVTPGGTSIYTVTVTDAHLCSVTVTSTLTSVPVVAVTTSITPPTCFSLCDGSAKLTPTSGTAPYQYAWSCPTSTTNILSGQCGGTSCSYTVTDKNNCIAKGAVTITPQASLTVVTSPVSGNTSVLCSNSNTGTLSVTNVSGGTSPYTFSWSPSSGTVTSTTNSSTYSGLTGSAGGTIYTCTITDKNNCSQPVTFTITSPPAITLTPTFSNPLCSSGTTGSATVTASGGTAPFIFVWTGSGTPSGSSPTSIYSNIGGGTYTVTATDNNSCTTSTVVTLTPASIVTATITTIVEPTCPNLHNGQLCVTAGGGTPGYSYSWTPSSAGTASCTPSTLTAGNYSVTVADANGCSVTLPQVLTAPPSVAVSTALIPPSCSSSCNASIILTPTSGASPYQYAWSCLTSTTNILSGQCGGTSCTYTVTDNNNCFTSGSITTATITPLTASVINIISTCSSCNGGATASVSGGTSPYMYSWDGGTFSAANLSTNTLCAGTHTLSVKDANGCSASASFVISPIASLIISVPSTSVSCNNSCDATAIATVSSGLSPYTIQWVNTGTCSLVPSSCSASGLCSGTQTVIATDAQGCSATTTITIGNPTALSASVTAVSLNCFGKCTGGATVTPSGGTPAGTAPFYTINWAAPLNSTGSSVGNLCAGTYTANILDNNGCPLTQTVAIGVSNQFSVTPVYTPPSTCGASDGSISLSISGGSGTYTVNWASGGTPVNSSPVFTYSNIPAGSYVATITDANGCDTTLVLGLSSPIGPVMNYTVTDASCFGVCDGSATVIATGTNTPITITWLSNSQTSLGSLTATGLCGNSTTTYTVKAKDIVGCITFTTVSVNSPLMISDNSTITNPICSGNNGVINLAPSGGNGSPYSYSWNGVLPFSSSNNPETGLPPGVDSVIIKDVTGCTQKYTYTLTSTTSPTVTVNTNSLSCSYFTAIATANINGGQGPYSYTWTSSSGSVLSSGINISSVSNLAIGIYSLNISDANNCTAQTTFTVTGPATLTATVMNQNALCNGTTGSATVIPAGGTPNYTYTWTATGSPTTNTVSLLPAGNYSVIVEDANSCRDTVSFNITNLTSLNISVSSTPPACFGGSNGTATVTVSGGTPFTVGSSYTYTWSNSNNTHITSGLSVASSPYTVSATDSLGCLISTSLVYTLQPSQINPGITKTAITCTGNCNGSISSSASGGTPGTTGYTFTWSPSGTSTITTTNSSTSSNLCAGTYTLYIADSLNCTDTNFITINPVIKPSLTYTTSPATCNTLPCNGSITITDTIGNGPINITWLNGLCGSSYACNNLCAGIYSVQLTDASSCIDTFQIQVSNLNGPVATPTFTNISCYNSCEGIAAVSNVTGNGPFTYSWSPNTSGIVVSTATSSIDSGLCANPGIYFSTITDNIGCQTIYTFTFTQPSEILDNEKISNALCIGLNTGSIIDSGSGGTPYKAGYLYAIDSGTFSASPSASYTFTGLSAGSHTVCIKDSLGCSNCFTYTILPNSTITYSVSTTKNTCYNSCNATAAVSDINGGASPYSVSWNDPNNQTDSTAINLCLGSYMATITDNIGCQANVTVAIAAPDSINPNTITTNPTCNSSNGAITLTPSGGTGTTYTYNWSNSSNTNSITNVFAGIYSVKVTDSLGCNQTFLIPISNTGNTPTVTTNISNLSCTNSCNALITTTVTGGTSPYSYWWPIGGQTTSSIANQCTGTYFVEVKDSIGCVSTQPVVVGLATSFSVSTTTFPTQCGACTGKINSNVTGGSGNYSYKWLPGGATTPNLTPVCAGIYLLTVTDLNTGCVISIKNIILNSSGGPLLTVTPTEPICNGLCNGSATVVATGGTLPYNPIIWNTSPQQNGLIANNLCGDSTYVVQVTDHASCIKSALVKMTQPLKLSAGVSINSPIQCYNDSNGSINIDVFGGTPAYTYSWNPTSVSGTGGTNLHPGIYTVTVTDANGCPSLTFQDTLVNPQKIAITSTVTPPMCNNLANGSILINSTGGTPTYTYQWGGNSTATTQNLTAIPQGTYSLSINDSRGCPFNTSFILVPTISITVNAGNDTTTCNKGPVVLTGTVTGATTFDWQTLTTPTSTLSQNTSTLSVSPTITTQYILLAVNGACRDSDTVTVFIAPLPLANAGSNQTLVTGQTATIGGNPTSVNGSSIVWYPNSGLSDTAAANPIASPTVTTAYVVIVKSKYGCEASDTMLITVLPPFVISGGFTPNGDGHNDSWVIEDMSLFPNVEIEIYNRWGERLFYSKGNYTAWTGTYDGKPVPVGTYYYIIRLNDPKYPDHYAGPLTILR